MYEIACPFQITGQQCKAIKFVVQKLPMSFEHPVSNGILKADLDKSDNTIFCKFTCLICDSQSDLSFIHNPISITLFSLVAWVQHGRKFSHGEKYYNN